MKLTPYHVRYFAHELAKRFSSASVDSLTSALTIGHSASAFVQFTSTHSAGRFSPLSALPTANTYRVDQPLTFGLQNRGQLNANQEEVASGEATC